MPHHLRRQLRRLATERSYQVAIASAAALVLASGGALLAGVDDAPSAAPSPASVADLRADTPAASRAQERVAATPSAAPSPSSAAPASAAPASPKAAATSAAPDPDLSPAPTPPARKILRYEHQTQTTYFYCGPAAVRNALSAGGVDRTQDQLAGPLGTDEFGTDSAEDTTRVLNALTKGDPYRTRLIPGGAATSAQTDRLRADVVAAITDGRAVVVNVAGTVTDTEGGWHSFPGGHYVAVVGYSDSGRLARIADSADPASPAYWVATADLADWIATRGYSA